MLNKLFGAAAMAAMAYSFAPAQAARVVVVGCSPDTFAKAEGTVDIMADRPGKFIAQREIAAAQDAMLSNNMRSCAMHLNQAMRAESMADMPYQTAPYPAAPAERPYAGSMAQAPYEETTAPAPAETTGTVDPTSSQPQWNWKPMKGAY